MSNVTKIDHTCKCGKRVRYVCTQQWQIDYAKKHKLGNVCDWCATRDAKPSDLDRDDARIEFQKSAREMHQMEADLKCQSM